MKINKSELVFFFALAIPCAAFLLLFIGYINYGLRLPNWDDWRYFLPGNWNPYDKFRPFRAVNDTVTAVPVIWDQLILYLVGYDFVALRWLSLVWLAIYISCLGVILYRFRDSFVAWLAIASASLAFRVGGYWDYHTYIAYHQGLPVIGLMMVFVLIRNHVVGNKLLGGARLALIALIAILMCGTYISGALAVFVSAVVFWFFWLLFKKRLNPCFLSIVVVLSVVGVVGLAWQLYSVVLSQGPIWEHSHVDKSIYPSDARFWFFAVGILAKGIGINSNVFWLNFIFVSVIFSLFGGVLISRFLADKGQLDENDVFALLIATTVIGVLAAYVFSVSFGRAALMPPDNYLIGLMVAKQRFHFWWISALLPFVLLSLYPVAKTFSQGWIELLIVVLLLFFGYKIFVSDSWDFRTHFSVLREKEMKGIQCVREKKLQSPEQILCEQFYPVDIKPALDLFDRNNFQLNRYFQSTE